MLILNILPDIGTVYDLSLPELFYIIYSFKSYEKYNGNWSDTL